jgi:hypothetical protein
MDCEGSIATGDGLDGRGFEFRVPIGTNFSPAHVVKTSSGAHSAFYPVDTGAFFPGVEGIGM